MVFTNTGKNKIRDLMADNLSKGQLGTDSTAPIASNTTLSSADATTDLVITTSSADKQINIDYNLPATTGNGTTYNEIGFFNADDVMFSRNVFTNLTKSSTEQWQISVSYKIN